MQVYLDTNSEVPLYQQIRNQVILGLAEGYLHNQDTLPPTRQLAKDFGINFHTVNKAYEMLRQEGIVRMNRKTGSVVVVDPPPDFQVLWRESVRILLAEGFVKGLTPEKIIAQCQSILADFQRSYLQGSGDKCLK